MCAHAQSSQQRREKMAGVSRVFTRSLGWLAVRQTCRLCGALHSSNHAPSRGLVYTTDLAEATVSLTSSRPLPVYRVMGAGGEVLDQQQDPKVGVENIITIDVKPEYSL